MFARVITAQAGPRGSTASLALPGSSFPARAGGVPGFQGYYVLTSAETGKVMIVSLWETREQMQAGVQDQGRPATGLTAPHLETYEVAMHA